MNQLMKLSVDVIDQLSTEEMLFINGGFGDTGKGVNNGSGLCDETNNGTGTCSGTNNNSGTCSETNNNSGLCHGTNNNSGTCTKPKP